MSSFPKRQPELFFNTKNLYSGGGTSQGSGSNLAAAGLAMMADKPLAAEDIDSVPDSWVELAPSRASLSSSIEAVNVESTSGGDASVNKDSRLSPVSLQSPHVEFESSLEQVKYRLVKDMLPIEAAKSTDWLWDWTNRSDAAVNTSENATRNRSGGQIGSTLTTPPNSPEPESSEFDFKSSMKSATAKLHQKKQQAQQKSAFHWSSLCRWDVFLAIVFTNIVTGAVVYYYLTRMQKSDDPFVEQAIITKYYW